MRLGVRAHVHVALVLALAALAASACGPADASTPVTVNIRIHYSRFEPASITVPAGVPVTYVIRNDDPIDHEWLVVVHISRPR